MEFVLLEMGVALGLLIVIVWWTWPKKDQPNDASGPASAIRGEPKE